MVSLWGSNKKDGDVNGGDVQTHDDGPSGNRSVPSRSIEPTERTRLLENAPPSRADGYLDPDDPAVSLTNQTFKNGFSKTKVGLTLYLQVSPYNLWTVRALRYFTVLFTMITFIWWVLLLVSIFVSPPGMNTPGSGFTDFAYTCLALGILLISLIFFTGPSQATRISMSIIAVLLLTDMIIILAVKAVRHQEGWVGIVSIVWAAIMAVWAVLIDRVVAWGKREEEERLTGRPESRRTLREWLGVFVATFIAVLYIVIVIFMTATLILRSIDAGLEMDGERYSVDGGKYSVHLQCIGDISKNPKTGKRDPTILLESGEVPSEYDFEHWAYSSWQNGTISRYCYWDRPGYAWSDDAPSPHSAGMSADALSEALANAGEEGPWISVSAGYGSIVGRIFVARHIKEVVGIMLIDPLHEDLLHRIGGASQGFSLWGYGIISPLGIQRIIGSIFYSQTKEDRTYGKSVWQTGKFLKAKLQENLVAESLTKSEVSSARNIMSDKTPLVVVSSGIKSRSDREWEDKQKDLTKLTNKLVSWDIVNKAPHEVWKTANGRQILEQRLGELVKAAK